ncbi:hypothetical protein CWI38_0005p0080 [Hamiltosporidium tvaerminnensis]|uniref:Uncharacterized protein n=1 Tax=Hamiltosporidium tvaerminnensis TaxID=1176355 RepID=A0A4Q9M5E0_9MICR|nr:hypothetical protein CWI38_0005p0080 [Hamiltosporidium tvaerminnensis]
MIKNVIDDVLYIKMNFFYIYRKMMEKRQPDKKLSAWQYVCETGKIKNNLGDKEEDKYKDKHVNVYEDNRDNIGDKEEDRYKDKHVNVYEDNNRDNLGDKEEDRCKDKHVNVYEDNNRDNIGDKEEYQYRNKYRTELEKKEIQLPKFIIENYKIIKTKMKFLLKIIIEKYFTVKIRIKEIFKLKEECKHHLLQLISNIIKELIALRVFVNSTKIFNYYNNYKIFISLVNKVDSKIRRIEKIIG